MKSGKLLIHS